MLSLLASSAPTCLDFHPASAKLLLVGTENGTVEIWDVYIAERVFIKDFLIRKLDACCDKVKNSKNFKVSAKKVCWSPKGQLFGIAFNKHFVHLYRHSKDNRGVFLKEIDAHDGRVNDLCFSSQELLSVHSLLVITCGEDKRVNAWNSSTAELLFTFDGHHAEVCSICTFIKDDIHYIVSTSIDGKFKMSIYHKSGQGVDIDRPGFGDCKLEYNAANDRLFLCGNYDDGKPYIVEWDAIKRRIIKSYEGLESPSSTIKSSPNKLLAAGDNHMVKFWHMDSGNLLSSTFADGELLEYPCICFDKRGSLLAVCAKNNGIKILEISRMPLCKRNYQDVSEISEPSQFQSLQLDTHSENMIERLMYNNAGNRLFALASNMFLRWTWQMGHANFDGQANVNVMPSYTELTRDDNRRGQPLFLHISNDDMYILSICGAAIKIFEYEGSQVPSSITASTMITCVTSHPNMIGLFALGMEDYTIRMFDATARVMEKGKLVGHTKKITALAFCKKLNFLISGDIDAEIYVWDVAKERRVQINVAFEIKKRVAKAETLIEFNQEGSHFLVAYDTHLATFDALEDFENDCKVVIEVPISRVTFSCDGIMIYAILEDETIRIFHATNLLCVCKIKPYAYLPSTERITVGKLFSSLTISVGGKKVKAVSIAANPRKPSQFAVGFSNGVVKVFQPNEKW